MACMTDFVAWPKTARWYRDIVVTEKIDGTNAAVIIEERLLGEPMKGREPTEVIAVVCGPDNPEMGVPDHEYWISAQSRNRLITPGDDNAGFARWVRANADTLVADLGSGRHFGEWWGRGIQRGYEMPYQMFSLFNTRKWLDSEFVTPRLSVVPVLYSGPNDPAAVGVSSADLRTYGSYAAADHGIVFYRPEGVCIFHTASNTVYKVTLEDDEIPKSILS